MCSFLLPFDAASDRKMYSEARQVCDGGAGEGNHRACPPTEHRLYANFGTSKADPLAHLDVCRTVNGSSITWEHKPPPVGGLHMKASKGLQGSYWAGMHMQNQSSRPEPFPQPTVWRGRREASPIPSDLGAGKRGFMLVSEVTGRRWHALSSVRVCQFGEVSTRWALDATCEGTRLSSWMSATSLSL